MLSDVTTPQDLDDRFRESLAALAAPPHRGDPARPVAEGSALTGTQLLDLFDAQVTSRQLDLAARWLRSFGEGYYTIGSAGHEGNAAVAAALRPTDPALLHYRSGAFYCVRAAQADPSAPPTPAVPPAPSCPPRRPTGSRATDRLQVGHPDRAGLRAGRRRRTPAASGWRWSSGRCARRTPRRPGTCCAAWWPPAGNRSPEAGTRCSAGPTSRWSRRPLPSPRTCPVRSGWVSLSSDCAGSTPEGKRTEPARSPDRRPGRPTPSWSVRSGTPRSTTPAPRPRSTPPAGTTTPACASRCSSSARTTGWASASGRRRVGWRRPCGPNPASDTSPPTVPTWSAPTRRRSRRRPGCAGTDARPCPGTRWSPPRGGWSTPDWPAGRNCWTATTRSAGRSAGSPRRCSTNRSWPTPRR